MVSNSRSEENVGKIRGNKERVGALSVDEARKSKGS